MVAAVLRNCVGLFGTYLEHARAVRTGNGAECHAQPIQTFDAAMRLQAPWVNRLSEGLSVKDVETTQRVMLALRQRLDDKEGA
jgi:hypothetical protein